MRRFSARPSRSPHPVGMLVARASWVLLVVVYDLVKGVILSRPSKLNRKAEVRGNFSSSTLGKYLRGVISWSCFSVAA